MKAVKQDETGPHCTVKTKECYNKGNFVRIRHREIQNGNTFFRDTLYLHLEHNSVPTEVTTGAYVGRGDIIGKADSTGYGTKEHLHFMGMKAQDWGLWESVKVSFYGDVTPVGGSEYTSNNYPLLTIDHTLSSLSTEDTEPPQGSVFLQLTGQPTHTLRMSAADYASDVTETRIASTEEGLQGAAWQPYAQSADWTSNAVFVQYRDTVGNVSAVVSDTIEATGYEPILASFAISPTVCVDQQLSLVNQTTPFCEQCSWNWDFGNGEWSDQASPEFDYTGQSSSFFGYATPGTYTVVMTVTNVNSSSIASGQVEAIPTPSPEFDLIRSGLTITVEAATTNAASWLWDFGDGITATGRIATHTYTSGNVLAEIPIVRLIVEGTNGCVSSAYRTVTPCYSLTTSVDPGGSGSIDASPAPNCGTQYTDGTEVTLSATANSGYTFNGWSGAASGSTDSTTVTMDGNKSVTANFSEIAACYSLTTSVDPSGSGSIDVSPAPNCGTQYTDGTEVTLSATANSGYTFNGWSEAATGSANPTTVTIDSNKSVTANFSAPPEPTYSISGRVTDNEGSGIADVTVTATASGASGLGTTATATAVTDSSGNYTLTVGAIGTYLLTFHKTGYTFEPVTVTVSVSNPNPTADAPPVSQGWDVYLPTILRE